MTSEIARRYPALDISATYARIAGLFCDLADEFKSLSEAEELTRLVAKYGRLEEIDIDFGIDLSIRTSNALRRGGFKYLQQVAEATWIDLLDLPSFGYKSAAELRSQLARRGIYLTDDAQHARIWKSEKGKF